MIEVVNPQFSKLNIDWTTFDQISVLGKGTFGAVNRRRYTAHTTDGNKKKYDFAVKELVDMDTFSEFLRELASLLALQGSPYIVTLQYMSIATRQLYLELADLDLMTYIRSKPNIRLTYIKKSVDLTSVAQLMQEIACGIQFMHSKYLYHRDLKPHNVLLFFNNSTKCYHAKITDFGLCRRILPSDDKSRPDDMSRPMYTLWYRGPEFLVVDRIDNEGENSECRVGYDPATTDVYALGMIFWDLLMYRDKDKYRVLRGDSVTAQWMALNTYVRPVQENEINHNLLMNDNSITFSKACADLNLRNNAKKSVRLDGAKPEKIWDRLKTICKRHETWPLLLWQMLSFSPRRRPNICDVLKTLGHMPQNCGVSSYVWWNKSDFYISERLLEFKRHYMKTLPDNNERHELQNLVSNDKSWRNKSIPSYIQPFTGMVMYMLNTNNMPHNIVKQYMEIHGLEALKTKLGTVRKSNVYFEITAYLYWLYGILQVISDYHKQPKNSDTIFKESCFDSEEIFKARTMILHVLKGDILVTD